MLAKARELGDTVEASTSARDADAIADALGAHGATKVHATGDLGGALQGVPVAAALAAAIEGGSAPDLILFGTTYDGRDIAGRLSVELDKPVLTNNIDIERRRRRGRRVRADLRRHTDRARRSSPPGRPHLALFRPKSFVGRGDAAAAPAEVVEPRACPTPAPPARPGSRSATSRSAAARSSTRRRSSCPAAAVSARPTSTR